MSTINRSVLGFILVGIFCLCLSGCGGGGSGGGGATMPAAPVALTTNAGNGQVTMNWTPVSGATSYNVYQGTAAGITKATGTKVGSNITASSFTVTGLTNGTHYFYVVTAVNAAGESDVSAEKSATPSATPPPAAPGNIRGAAGVGKATISWDTSAGATSYNIYYATSKGVTKTGIKVANAVSPQDVTLTNGTTYFFVVTAVNANGESATSSEVFATPAATPPPAAPTGATATAGNGQVTISWNAVSGATSYNIYWSTTSGVTKTSGTRISGSTSPFTHSGRTNGSTYYYVVTAVNSFGESVASIQVSAMPTVSTYASGPIRIRADDQFTGANGVVGGAGTQSNPYIIEGWTIDASASDTNLWPYITAGISIDHTSKYFVIRNCTIKNAGEYGVGISLGFLSNGRVESTVVRSSGTGISLASCSNVVLNSNMIENCSEGISNGSYSSDNITISNNTITGSTDTGIYFFNLTNSTASGNSVKNSKAGIYVSSSAGCTINNNIVQGNTNTGIEVKYSNSVGGDNNTITYNDTSNNGIGISVYGSYDIISYNTSNGNSGRGILLDYIGLTDITASNNTVSNNTTSHNGGDGIYTGSGCINNKILNNTSLSNNTLNQYYFDGTPWYYDINVNASPNTIAGNSYGTIYIYLP
jgi:parallel beta-helix repeat protein